MMLVILYLWTFLSLYFVQQNVSAENANDCGEEAEAIKKLQQLTQKNMHLMIVLSKYEFTPSKEWKDYKKDVNSALFRSDDREDVDSAFDSIQTLKNSKKRTVEFYKIQFIVRMNPIFDFHTYDYLFRDKKQKVKVKQHSQIRSKEEEASLKISPKNKGKKGVEIDFTIGSKQHKISNINSYFYDKEDKKENKDAILDLALLDMGKNGTINYHIFLYLLKKGGKAEFPKKKVNAVYRIMNNIIQSHNKKNASGSYEFTKEEKVFGHLGEHFCGYLRLWLEAKGADKVKINLFEAVKSMVKDPEKFLGQKALEYDFSGIQVSQSNDPVQKKLFSKYFKKFANTIKKDKKFDFTSEKLDKLQKKFLTLMKENFEEYRKAKHIKSKFNVHDQQLEVSVKESLRSGKLEDDGYLLKEMFKNVTVTKGNSTCEGCCDCGK